MHPMKKIRELKDRMMLNRKSFVLYMILRGLVILTAVRCFLEKNYESFLLCLLSLFLFLLPAYFSEKLKVRLTPRFESIIYLFIYAAEILGEVNRYYTRIPGWDTMLHTLNGFLCAAIGFSLVDILNRNSRRISLSPAYLAFVAFCFSMTIGVCWEFVEYTVDKFFLLDMQKDTIVKTIGSVTLDSTNSQIPVRVSDIDRTIILTESGKKVVVDGGYLDIGLNDTMKDLFVNFLGAVTFSVIGYISDKKGAANRELRQFSESLKVKVLTDEEAAEEDEQIMDNKAELHREWEDRKKKYSERFEEDRELLEKSIEKEADRYGQERISVKEKKGNRKEHGGKKKAEEE